MDKATIVCVCAPEKKWGSKIFEILHDLIQSAKRDYMIVREYLGQYITPNWEYAFYPTLEMCEKKAAMSLNFTVHELL